MTAVDLTEEHLRSIEFRQIERDDLGDTLGQEQLDYFMSSNYKKAVFNGDKIVMALGGIMEESICRTWLIANDSILDNPVASLETLMLLELDAFLILNPEYLYTLNHPNHPMAIKFLKRIGYKEVGKETDPEDKIERIVLVKRNPYGK